MKQHEYFVSTHPGEDRDTDSEEDDDEETTQVPIPIQDEPVDEEIQADSSSSQIVTEEGIVQDQEEVTQGTSENSDAENDDDPMGENEQ